MVPPIANLRNSILDWLCDVASERESCLVGRSRGRTLRGSRWPVSSTILLWHSLQTYSSGFKDGMATRMKFWTSNGQKQLFIKRFGESDTKFLVINIPGDSINGLEHITSSSSSHPYTWSQEWRKYSYSSSSQSHRSTDRGSSQAISSRAVRAPCSSGPV